MDGRAGLGWLLRDALSAEYDIARTYYLIGQASPQFVEAYLMVMGYNLTDISDYVELAKLYRKLEG